MQRGNVWGKRAWAEIGFSLVALAVFLALPTLRTHHFSASYRPVEIRHTTSRQSFLAQGSEDPSARIVRAEREPSRPDLVPPVALAPAPVAHEQLPPPTPPGFLLKRMKIGSSAHAPSDPIS